MKRLVILILMGLSSLFLMGATNAQAASCSKIKLSAGLVSKDPTEILDNPSVYITTSKGKTVTNAKADLYLKGKKVAFSSVLPTMTTTGTVKLTFLHSLKKGTYWLVSTARQAGCKGSINVKQKVNLKSPSLPVRIAPSSTLLGDNKNGIDLIVRSVNHSTVKSTKLKVLDRLGVVVASATVPSFKDETQVTVPVKGILKSGQYSVTLSGKVAGSRVTRDFNDALAFSPGTSKPLPETGTSQQNPVVDWSNGKSDGRDTAGFVAPGIGHGEIVCSPNQQWIRFFPNDAKREVTMMNWTYKDWGGDHEKAIREAIHTTGTGPDFREGFNKFTPAEKTSTGEYQGIITDRGVIGTPLAVDLAAPTTFRLTWSWDFSNDKKSRCHVEAIMTSQSDSAKTSTARSAQVVWHGDANAPKESTVVDVPGLGNMTLTCQAGTDGIRRLVFDTPAGATVTTRESSTDAAVPYAVGPITVELPNNGMVRVDFTGGQTALISSRYKTNDPDQTQNFCAIAAQVVTS